MKKAFLLFFALTLFLVLFSCTPQSLNSQTDQTEACCGDDFTAPDPEKH